jgi:hypothetical protein
MRYATGRAETLGELVGAMLAAVTLGATVGLGTTASGAAHAATIEVVISAAIRILTRPSSAERA